MTKIVDPTAYPHLTVACVIKKDDKYLMVKEQTETGICFNQPAGHVEIRENVIDAAKREVFEETAWHVNVTGFLGLSHYFSPKNGVTYVRLSFVAEPVSFDEHATLDPDILVAQWMSLASLYKQKIYLRSPLVLRDIERFERGKIFPLSFITNDFSSLPA